VGGTDTNWWQELRAEFPYLEDHVFAWSGGQVPIANSVRAAIGRVMASWDDDPVTLATTEWPVFDGARQEVATLFDYTYATPVPNDSRRLPGQPLFEPPPLPDPATQATAAQATATQATTAKAPAGAHA